MTRTLTHPQSHCSPPPVPETVAEKSPLLLRLQRHPAVNTLVKTLRLHRAADLLLGWLPLGRATPAGLRYEVRSIASLVAAQEIFGTEMYRAPLRGEPVRRFVDLGCNVGFFPLLLADLTGSRALEGLMIDGNEAVLAEARTHLRANQLGGVEVILGLAGFSATQAQADFLINPGSHIASTATGKLNPAVPSAGRSVRVTVPCIDVEAAWQQRFGDAPIDLLKVDIEGMELELFRHAPGLLGRTQRLLFEWHKWQVSIADCTAALTAAGFAPPQTVWEDAQHGLAYCHRVAGPVEVRP